MQQHSMLVHQSTDTMSFTEEKVLQTRYKTGKRLQEEETFTNKCYQLIPQRKHSIDY